MNYSFEPIGIVRSPYTGKFGIPRQPRLVTAARSRLELFPAFARSEAFAGLDGFSHLWLVFVFHDHIGAGWKPTVTTQKWEPRCGRGTATGPSSPTPSGPRWPGRKRWWR